MSHLTDAASTGQVPEPSTQYSAFEGQLNLPDGRTLAYSVSGPADSDIIVLWCHGLFSVGDASKPSKVLRDRGVRFIAPTFPGWGDTSPLPAGSTFPETVVSDTRALFQHLYPSHDGATSKLRIYVAGGSFGTCPAQIISGASYDKFPHGRQIVALLLVAPFSPFHEDRDYNSSLTWRDWVGVGGLTRVVPNNLIARALKLALQGKVRDTASAEKLLRGMYFDNMAEEEKRRFAAWRERNGLGDGEFERKMAAGMVKSVSKSWEGFIGTADALHADWGFRIDELDEEHARKVVIAVGKDDASMFKMSKYLVDHYKDTRLIQFEGGHLAAAWSMDDIWVETFAVSER